MNHLVISFKFCQTDFSYCPNSSLCVKDSIISFLCLNILGLSPLILVCVCVCVWGLIWEYTPLDWWFSVPPHQDDLYVSVDTRD